MSYQITNKTITELQTRIEKLELLPQSHRDLMPQITEEIKELKEMLNVKIEQQEWSRDTSRHATEKDLCYIYRQ